MSRNNMRDNLIEKMSVSYTHLDVYKRQVYKKAIIEYEKLEDEWRLFRRANFQSVDDMEEYRKKLDEELKACYRNKRNLPQGSEERDAVDKQIKEYYHNKRVLARIEKRIDEQQLDGQERQTRAADKGRRDR